MFELPPQLPQVSEFTGERAQKERRQDRTHHGYEGQTVSDQDVGRWKVKDLGPGHGGFNFSGSKRQLEDLCIGQRRKFVLLRQQLGDLEQLESSAWKWVAESEGTEAQRDRIGRWLVWHEKQVDHLRSAKKLMWDAGAASRRRQQTNVVTVGRARRGHVEKVKLPTFSGRQEDFPEFRNQFRELCKGEQYTPVLEMAQLKQKLPREALAAIGGLQCPEISWKRLEEVYGNREILIMSAIKNLRDFKSSKPAPHEQTHRISHGGAKVYDGTPQHRSSRRFVGG